MVTQDQYLTQLPTTLAEFRLRVQIRDAGLTDAELSRIEATMPSADEIADTIEATMPFGTRRAALIVRVWAE